MKNKLVISIVVLAFCFSCSEENGTEPEGSNPEDLGQGMFINQSEYKPAGLTEFVINSGDTVQLVVSTILLKTPQYSWSSGDAGVLKIVAHESVDSIAYAIALGDSGAATTLKVTDSGNNAAKTIPVKITHHWADPDYFDLIGKLGGHTYYLSKEIRFWVQAQELCHEMGAHLVAINSEEENNLLDDGRGNVDNVWIGLRFNKVGTSWKLNTWVTGEALEYENFVSKPGDPGIFAEYYFHFVESGKWENWHEIGYRFFVEFE